MVLVFATVIMPQDGACDAPHSISATLSVQGFEMNLADIGWRDNQTALVLLGDPGAQLQLHALPLDAFSDDGKQLLATFAGQIDFDHVILYVPN
jgi:hypothetical protein